MPTIITEKSRDPIRRVRVQVGKDWIEESTSGDFTDDEARSRLLSMVERLVPRSYR